MKQNFIKYIKLSVIVVISLLLLVLALPDFNLNLGGNNISYSGIDLSIIGVYNKFPSLKASQDFLNRKEYRSTISFTADSKLTEPEKELIIDNYFKNIQIRLEKSGFNQINLNRLKINSNNVVASISMPENFQAGEEIARLLTAKGDIDFVSAEGNQTLLNDFDITKIPTHKYYELINPNASSSIAEVPYFTVFFGELFELETSVEKGLELQGAFQRVNDEEGNIVQSGLLFMNVDGKTTLQLAPMFNRSTQQLLSWKIVGLPFNNLGSNINAYYNVLSYLFAEEVPNEDLQVVFDSENVSTTSNKLGSLDAQTIMVSICVGFLLISFSSIKKLGFIKSISTSYIVFFNLLGTIVLLKLFQANLGLPTLFGILFVMSLNFILCRNLVDEDFNGLKNKYASYLTMFLMIAGIFVVIMDFNQYNSVWIDFFGVIIINSITSIFTYFIFSKLSMYTIGKTLSKSNIKAE